MLVIIQNDIQYFIFDTIMESEQMQTPEQKEEFDTIMEMEQTQTPKQKEHKLARCRKARLEEMPEQRNTGWQNTESNI